ncbi:hypothetical protein NU09_0736 [Flavobacterium beibuense]|uniref:Uncharacterized protein n=1 Tax=Flavobacterium beibuense TaxID=657326 RepID=A0A444WH70_9FLAO|nr:hypothetical protein NU09_0736 [Flavobacterium beibuense]
MLKIIHNKFTLQKVFDYFRLLQFYNKKLRYTITPNYY